MIKLKILMNEQVQSLSDDEKKIIHKAFAKSGLRNASGGF